jgi:hypothetical protein
MVDFVDARPVVVANFGLVPQENNAAWRQTEKVFHAVLPLFYTKSSLSRVLASSVYKGKLGAFRSHRCIKRVLLYLTSTG